MKDPTRALAVTLVGVALSQLGCRTPRADAPTPRPTPSARTTAKLPAQPDAQPRSVRTPSVDARAPHLDPVPTDADPCERSCGLVHDCLLSLERTTAAAATRVELECLRVCVERKPRSEDPFACAPPLPSDDERELRLGCGRYLECVEQAWTPPKPRPEPPPFPLQGRGCARACQAFAHCEGLDHDGDQEDRSAIEHCVELCTAALDPEQETQAGACTELGDCESIERCMRAIPGA